jgi:hypothetical protein
MRPTFVLAVLSLSLSLSLCTCLPGHAQTSPLTVGGVITNQLSTPTAAPTVKVVCSGGTSSYTYVYIAMDASGGNTGQSPTSTSVSGCTTLSASNFNIVSVPAISGSTSCVVYRTAPSVVNVGSVPCGGAILDATAGTTTTVPAGNSTGGVNATGTVSGQNFIATGTGAGTSDWVAGTALPACTSGTQPQPCIQTNSFFIQAPGSPITTFGWTAPSATNTAAGPIIAGASSGTPVTSALNVGFLTDTTINLTMSQPTVATVTGSLPNGDIVKISNAGAGAIDLVDAAISASEVAQLNAAETFTAAQTFSATPAGVIATGQVKAAGYVDTTMGYLASNMSAQTSTTPMNITGMAWNITASKNYRLDCEIGVTQTASATVAFELAGPGSPTSYNLIMEGPLGASGVYKEIGVLAQTSWGVSTGASTSLTASIVIHVKAQIQNSTTSSGTQLTLQTVANGTNSITVLANSVCVLTQAN